MTSKRLLFFRNHFGIFVSLLLTIFALLPLFQPGFFPMHDDEQVGRLYELDVAIKAWHIPPRIAPDLGFGYGYPLFNFYPSFVYYFAEMFVLLGFSYILSIKLMIACGMFAAAYYMYLFAREYFGDTGGVIASVAYTYAPYHAVDLYVRGALPEFWSFAFIPLLFWSYKKLKDTGQTHYSMYAALGIAGLILTHNLVALMSAVFLGIYLIYLLIQVQEKKQFITLVSISGVLGLLLPAYFWIPSFFEKKYTMIELLTTELADYRQHFVYLRQLWNSPWGYGGSLYGLYDGLSFQIGKLHIIFSLLAGFVAVSLSGLKKKQGIVLLFFIFFGLSVFLISFYSEFIWNAVKPLSYIQFPWRFLLFASFTSAFLLGMFALLPVPKKLQLTISSLIILGIITLNAGYFVPAKYLYHVTDKDYISQSVLRWRTSVMAFEYVPRGIATKTSSVGTTVVDITESQVAKGPYQVQRGNVAVTTLLDKPQEKIFRTQASQSAVLTLNTYSFPGWKVYVDGKEVTYSDENDLKLITIAVPSGKHEVKAEFTDTPLRQMSNLLSLLGLGGLGFLWFYPRIRLMGEKKR